MVDGSTEKPNYSYSGKVFVKFECKLCHKQFCVMVAGDEKPTCPSSTCDSREFSVIDQVGVEIVK